MPFITVKKAFYAYKKVRGADINYGYTAVIVKLLIPKGASIRVEGDDVLYNFKIGRIPKWTASKIRATSAKVVSVTRLSSKRPYTGKTRPMSSVITYGKFTNYKVGKIVRPSYFDCRDVACGGGIHFFLNRSCAENY